MTDFSYGLLTSVEYKKGLLFGELSLLASGVRTRVHQLPKDLVDQLVQIIRDRMALAGGHSTPSATTTPLQSTADELLRLGSLRDAGIRTEKEFAQQNAKLLGLVEAELAVFAGAMARRRSSAKENSSAYASHQYQDSISFSGGILIPKALACLVAVGAELYVDEYG